jgi:hypothetical protein
MIGATANPTRGKLQHRQDGNTRKRSECHLPGTLCTGRSLPVAARDALEPLGECRERPGVPRADRALVVVEQHRVGKAEFADRGLDLRELLWRVAAVGRQLLPFYRGLLAEIEAEGRDLEAALASVDEALALAGETGEHWFDAALHRIRGEILRQQNPADPTPADPTPAEAAFLAAIAVAQQQKARSFDLRAALSLAKLYQSTGRPIEAHDVLGPALQGFAPTPEFPQIAEAKRVGTGIFF